MPRESLASPFLENFLIDADDFWAARASGRLRSGPWTEVGPTGTEFHLEASAVCVGERRILLLESEGYEEKQADAPEGEIRQLAPARAQARRGIGIAVRRHRRAPATEGAFEKRKAGKRMMSQEEQKKNPLVREESKGGNGPSAAAERKKGALEPASGAEAAGPGNLEKIRDILFGAQVNDFEKKFARLEDRLLKETSDSRAEAKKRFESLEAFIRKEIEALADRIKTETAERAESGKELGRELRETGRSLEKKLGQLDEQTTKSQRELRQQILDQSKSLTEEIRNRVRESAAALSRELSELRAEKTDRAALAGVFTDAAMRLTGDLKVPGKE